MDLSIIIVNYKAWHTLSITLNGLQDILRQGIDFEVIVVDNASGDGRLSGFIGLYPTFTFVENTGNWGFADACNLGARNSSKNYLLFLNPDTLPNAGAILALHSSLVLDTEYAILTCLQNDKNELKLRLFPNLFTLFWFTRIIYRWIHRAAIQTRSCGGHGIALPDWVSGSIVMMPRHWFERVGGWDPDFWMYSEDTDLSKRIANLGGKIGLLCGYKMQHRHGGASRIDYSTTSITKTEVKISHHVYIQKHFTRKTKALAHVFLIVNNLFFNFPLALLGFIFFFSPPLSIFGQIYIKILNYYVGVWSSKNWISPRSKNYRNTRD